MLFLSIIVVTFCYLEAESLWSLGLELKIGHMMILYLSLLSARTTGMVTMPGLSMVAIMECCPMKTEFTVVLQ